MAKTEQQVWARHIQQWKNSGLTAKAYAAREGIAMGTFYGWSVKYRKAQQAEQARFIQVATVDAPESRSCCLEVRLGSDIVIPVEPGFDPDLLRAVVAALVLR